MDIEYVLLGIKAKIFHSFEGRTGGFLARFTNGKKRSQITDIKISFSRITKIST